MSDRVRSGIFGLAGLLGFVYFSAGLGAQPFLWWRFMLAGAALILASWAGLSLLQERDRERDLEADRKAIAENDAKTRNARAAPPR